MSRHCRWAVAPMAWLCPRRGTERRYTISKMLPLVLAAALAACLENQPRKSLRLCLARLRVRCFDPIAEPAELPDHSCRALLFRSFGDGLAPFFVADALMQDQPDQPTLSMGYSSDGLVMSQTRDRAAIHNFEDASLGPGCSVGRLPRKSASKITALVLGSVEGSVFRSDSRACGVARSFLPCAFVSIVW